MRIGCQDHTIDYWLSADDARIGKMHPDALVFWRTWKPVITSIVSSDAESVISTVGDS